VTFLDIRTSKPLLLRASSTSDLLQLSLSSDSLELCGDLSQDLFAHLSTSECEPHDATFPPEMLRLASITAQIEQHAQLKTHFSANIAESMTNLKVQIVKAEASLMIEDVESMKKSYAVVQQENGALIGEYIKRSNNHQELVASLKELNSMIKNASNLRCGGAQKRVVALARECIRNSTYKGLQGIFMKGRAAAV
jgi:Bardet-Biedl syndrome 2 protein